MGTNLNMPLARQTSIYSYTFDELQNSVGKDFGSMNMDELVKNISLQRQGSLTLHGTLSTKTVDEVWKDMPNLPQRQQTLGEMTLEEFLVRAGVEREDIQLEGAAFFQHTGFMGNQISDSTNQFSLQSPNLPMNVNGVRQHQKQLFPKHPAVAYASQLASPGIVGMSSPALNQLSSDGLWKSNGDTSSVSSVPYVFNGGLRGRRSNGTVEKVVETRQRRMIKNRESAARSRARKQITQQNGNVIAI